MKKVILVLWGALVLTLGACATREEGEGVTLKMVFVPASDVAQEEEFKGLLTIVEQLTGYNIDTINVSDYNAAVESMRVGRADMAWFGAETYVMASEIAGAEAFAAGIMKGDEDPSYYVHFIVRKDSDIKEFSRAELQGRSLALNHIGSTSGDLVPRHELTKIDLDTERQDDFEFVQYAGSHDAAIMAVINEHVDFAGVSSRNYDARVRDGTFAPDNLRIIHSAYVPPPPLAYSKNLPQEVKDNVKEAVLDAHNHGTIGGYGGEMERYVAIEDEDFEGLRAMSREMRR